MKPLQKNSVVLLEQIRTIDRIRLLEYIGSLSELRMISIDQALSLSIGLTMAEKRTAKMIHIMKKSN